MIVYRKHQNRIAVLVSEKVFAVFLAVAGDDLALGRLMFKFATR